MSEGGGFGGGRALVQKGGIGDLHSGEFENHGLVVEEGFEAALGDFGLVRGVGAVPTRILEDGATEDRWGDGAVISEADEGAEGFVFREDLF